MNKVIFFLTILISQGISQVNIQDVHWDGPRQSEMIGLIIGAVCTTIIFILYIFWQSKRQKNNEEQFVRNLFNRYSKEKGLTDLEKKTLNSIAKQTAESPLYSLFESPAIFEESEHKYIEMIITKVNDLKTEDEILSKIRKKLGYHFLSHETPLFSTRNISLGQICSLFGDDKSNPIIEKAVVKSMSEFAFTIEYSVEHNAIFRGKQGQKYQLGFTRKFDGVYSTYVTLLSVDQDGALQLSHNLELKRNQLRQFVRFELSTNLTATILAIPGNSATKTPLSVGDMIVYNTTDISGGGIGFIGEQVLSLGTIVDLEFSFDTEIFQAEGKILRISLIERSNSSVPLFKFHLQFISFETGKRDKLVKKIFEAQRKIQNSRGAY